MKFNFLDWNKKDSVKLTHIFPHCTSACSPSKDQLVMVWTAAGGEIYGLYSQRFNKTNWFKSFCEFLFHSLALQKALPNTKYISADNVCNARVRAKLQVKPIKENWHSIDTYQYNKDMALGLLRGLDNFSEDKIDTIIQCSREMS